jgi:hypothetical protein
MRHSYNQIDFNTKTICLQKIDTCISLPKTAFYVGTGLLISSLFFNNSKGVKSKKKK